MKISLRTKLFFGFISLNLITSVLLGLAIYRTVSSSYIDDFLDHKLSIARVISLAIDGDFHARLTSGAAMSDPRYKHYLDFMNSIKKKEPDIQYIHTINYNRNDGNLYYAIDSNIPDHDVIWFETGQFCIDIFFDRQNRLVVEYNNSNLHTDFDIHSAIGTIRITFRNDPDGRSIAANGIPILTVLNVDPLAVKTPAGTVSNSERVKEGPITVNGKELTATISYNAKGETSSYPGVSFIEKKELIDKLKSIMDNRTDYVDREAARLAYGNYYTARSTILNSRGEGIGCVLVVINAKKIDEFKANFIKVSVSVFLLTFMISALLTVYLARHFTIPLAGLMKGVDSVAAGNMTDLVEINSSDEFSTLNKSFNTMVMNLKNATEEEKRLFNEINLLNESLEQRVIERTRTIHEQSEELNRQMVMARRIQLSLLPARLPDVPSVSLAFKYQPMMQIGGDFVDFHVSSNTMMLFICDVSGHGVPASLLSSMAKMSLPACYAAGRDVMRAMDTLRQSLVGKMGDHYISAVFCHIDLATGEMVSANAGHPPVIILRRDEGVEVLNSHGRIISEKLPLNAKEIVTRLEPGDKVVLYTDGITEALNEKKVMFGEEYLMEILRGGRTLSAEDLCEEIYRTVINHLGAETPEFDDDITLMVSEYIG
jgi:serine phosphatase RsbU (regulator of sigma subunit)